MRLSVLMLLFLVLSATPSEHTLAQNIRPPSLDSLAVLELDSIGGVATAYFRPAHRTRALELHSLLRSYLAFYREHAGLESRMRVAVLDSTDWARLTNTPYGLPTNSGPGGDNLLLAASTPPERIGTRAMPRGRVGDYLTIGHEGGHLLTWGLLPADMQAAIVSPDPPSAELMARFNILNRLPPWYWEMVANYFATAFLEGNNPEGAAAWHGYLREITAIERPRFTHLGDWFGRVMQATAADSTPYQFTPEGALNQGWYQGVVGQVAAHIYQQLGLGFIPQIRSVFAASVAPTTQELVEQFEAAAPGVTKLLQELGSEWRNPTSAGATPPTDGPALL